MYYCDKLSEQQIKYDNHYGCIMFPSAYINYRNNCRTAWKFTECFMRHRSHSKRPSLHTLTPYYMLYGIHT